MRDGNQLSRVLVSISFALWRAILALTQPPTLTFPLTFPLPLTLTLMQMAGSRCGSGVISN